MNDPIVIARLDQLNTRLQQYLDAEAKILQSQEYVIGNGGTARRNRRADLEQVQAGITQVRAEIAQLEAQQNPRARRITYLRPY